MRFRWLFCFCVWAAFLLRAAEVTLPAGTTLSVRLRTAVSSEQSKPGDPIECMLIAPVRVNGEEVMSSGWMVRGSVARAGKEQDRSILRPQFSMLIGEGGGPVAIQAKVSFVDNARESVDQQGTIHGIRVLREQPGRLDELLLLAAYAHPVVLASVEAGRLAVDVREAPEVSYAPGVEMTLVLTSPVQIDPTAFPPGKETAQPLIFSAELSELVRELPLRTTVRNDARLSDLTNLLFLGTKAEIIAAFEAAGWNTAAALNLRSDVKTFLAVADRHSYRHGPVSVLLLDGKFPALVFQKQNNTFAKRHHVRIWQRPEILRGAPVWIGAATHDIGIDFSREARTFTHQVAPQIDQERQKVVDDLCFTGRVAAKGLIERPDAPRRFQNGTGDQLEADGAIAVMQLR